MPVLTNVSQGTRAPGSSLRIASRTPSEIWSATLSGCPSVTDSDVKRCSPSASGLEFGIGEGETKEPAKQGLLGRGLRPTAAARVRDEVDDQRHALQPVGLAHLVLQVVGPIAADQLAIVD